MALGATRTPTTLKVPLRNSKLGRQQAESGSFAVVVFTAPDYDTNTEKELIVGAGIRSVGVSQDMAVEPIFSMGWGDIVEHVNHGVRSNSMTIAKSLFAARQLSKIGLANWGIGNLSAPTLNATVYSTVWRQIGNNSSGAGGDIRYLRGKGLHLSSNRMDIASGQVITENITYMVDRFLPVEGEGDYARELYKQSSKLFPELYSSFGSAQEFAPFEIEN